MRTCGKGLKWLQSVLPCVMRRWRPLRGNVLRITTSEGNKSKPPKPIRGQPDSKCPLERSDSATSPFFFAVIAGIPCAFIRNVRDGVRGLSVDEPCTGCGVQVHQAVLGFKPGGDAKDPTLVVVYVDLRTRHRAAAYSGRPRTCVCAVRVRGEANNPGFHFTRDSFENVKNRGFCGVTTHTSPTDGNRRCCAR